MNTKRAPFPLQWPDGWKRTRWRQGSNFEKGRGFNAARDGALDELRKMSAGHVVITSNLPTNSKGLPHSASAGRLDDPGIAVWWVSKGTERVMACDRWSTAVENMHAIELSLAAMRGLDRWGCTEVVERAFAGFAALPPGDAPAQPGASQNWRAVFNVNAYDMLAAADMLVIVKGRYRTMIADAHPDAGGSTELATEINAAYAAAEKELS